MVSVGERRARPHPVRPTWPTHLDPGDLVVVNTSATVAAALDGRLGRRRAPSSSTSPTELPGGLWLVEVRRPGRRRATEPLVLDGPQAVTLRRRRHGPPASPASPARAGCGSPASTLAGTRRPTTSTRHGRPIRYRYVARDWPLDDLPDGVLHRARQRRDAQRGPTLHRPRWSPTSSAGASRSPRSLLHTGVSSLEGHETPYPERYRVPAADRRAGERHPRRRRPGRRRRHHGRAGARDGDRRGRAPPTPARAGPRWSSPPSGASGRSTAC